VKNPGVVGISIVVGVKHDVGLGDDESMYKESAKGDAGKNTTWMTDTFDSCYSPLDSSISLKLRDESRPSYCSSSWSWLVVANNREVLLQFFAWSSNAVAALVVVVVVCRLSIVLTT
jgi:hypothetical protein